MKLEDIKNVYFLGIGGIGMSAIARWFKANGYWVSGYDKTATTLTRKLEAEGIAVHYDDAIQNIPPTVISGKSKTLVVYTPAIPFDNQEFNFLQVNRYAIKKRAEVLGIITSDMFTIAIAGTHGKTTTASMVAHILIENNIPCTAFLGGITANYNSNLLFSKEKNAIAVVEADEYDRSFLSLNPDLAVITSSDADHLDIYGDKETIEASFINFAGKVKPKGMLLIKHGISIAKDLNPTYTYGLNEGDIQASEITINEERFLFKINFPGESAVDTVIHIPGFHNVDNSLAAITLAKHAGIGLEACCKALNSFKGVKRRFEFILRKQNFIYLDDYAHHPTEIEALLNSVRAIYPEKKITAIFQPHLYSRTRDFASGFAQSLSLADEVILLDIYPAREIPISGVSSKLIFEKMTISEKLMCGKSDLLEILKKGEYEVVLTIGAGDIDTLITPIKNLFDQKYDA